MLITSVPVRREVVCSGVQNMGVWKVCGRDSGGVGGRRDGGWV